jgi:hypothetical protein
MTRAEEIDLRDANIWRSDPVPANRSDLVCAAILLSRVVKAKTEKALDIFQAVTRVLLLLGYYDAQEKIACQSLGFEPLLQVRSHKTRGNPSVIRSNLWRSLRLKSSERK